MGLSSIASSKTSWSKAVTPQEQAKEENLFMGVLSRTSSTPECASFTGMLLHFEVAQIVLRSKFCFGRHGDLALRCILSEVIIKETRADGSNSN